MKGATWERDGTDRKALRFNPRPREGGDKVEDGKHVFVTKFQSTPP